MPGHHTWKDLAPDDRKEIREALEEMQGRRCAYCEGDLDNLGQHIEHFRQRARFPGDMFQWRNLFWSCECLDSCGKHKDSCSPYLASDLIDPSQEDPERFFLFISDGSISVRANISAQEQKRAVETLRIFNLNPAHGRLRRMRQMAVSGYLDSAKEISELAQFFSINEVQKFFADEVAEASKYPFSTAIKHALTPQ
jgi:uncharacterized protein (TIGR02646 family)